MGDLSAMLRRGCRCRGRLAANVVGRDRSATPSVQLAMNAVDVHAHQHSQRQPHGGHKRGDKHQANNQGRHKTGPHVSMRAGSPSPQTGPVSLGTGPAEPGNKPGWKTTPHAFRCATGERVSPRPCRCVVHAGTASARSPSAAFRCTRSTLRWRCECATNVRLGCTGRSAHGP